MSLRDLSQISIERDISETSQKHLKRDVFFVTSLRRLKYISKKMSFPWRLWDVSKTSLASIFGFPKICHNLISCDFRRLIAISDKIDVGPSETLKKWIVLWEQCIDIKSAKWADIYVRDLASQGSSKSNSKCIIYYFQRFFLTDKTTYNLLSLWTVLTPCWNT